MLKFNERAANTVQNPESPDKVLFLNPDGVLQLKDSAGTLTSLVAENSTGQSTARPFKVYKALLTQTGTSAPVATVLENTLGFTVDWVYGAEGGYKTDTGGLLIENTYLVLFGAGRSFKRVVSYFISGDNEVELYTYLNEVQSDDVINTPISVLIEVYP